ncbi:hypothetical protein FQN53_007229 [Emmonsiellopsis sp. PD_33]|nr:hypothetical protein FQN53_007229 [Emmonsiellopsis sp. PD_33]
MPSPLPSSFASAAAGNTHDSSGLRKEGIGGGEWSRTRMNGATQTFRRPSLATNISHSRDNPQTTSSTSTPTVAAYIPPHLNSNYQSGSPRNGGSNDSRYSKDQLLSLYKNQQEPGNWGKQVADYFMGDWNPHEGTTSSAVNGGWNKREDFKDNHTGPEVCWDHSGHVRPLALTEMNDEEKDLFSGSVNSPLKPPPQGGSKDNAGTGGTAARKSSISHSQGHTGPFNTSSPGAVRTAPRRRGTNDSTANPMSPTGNSRFFRDDTNTSTPPPSLLRRKTDFRDSESKLDEKDKENTGRDGSGLDLSSPFGSLKRSATNPVVPTVGGSASPWPSSSHGSAFSPMGAFGAFSLGPTGSQGGIADKKPGFGSLRGESRFKGLLSKDSSEDIGSSVKEKPSLTTLDRLPESENSSPQRGWGDSIKTRAVRSETNPFGDEPRSGSAALGGQDLDSPAASGIDQFGLSFGITPNGPSFRDLVASQQTQPNQTPNHVHGQEPMSPTNTNPYQSPQGERVDADDIDTDGSDIQHTHLPGLSEIPEDPGMGAFGSIRRGGSAVDPSAGDRSQTSSVGGNRGFPSLTGLGGLGSLSSAGGWPTSATAGTPTRERAPFSSGFGDPIFGSMADIQSPSISALGGGGFFGSHAGVPGAGRASKMGSLFPAAMQDQMRGEQTRPDSTGIDGSMRPQGDNRSAVSPSPFDASLSRRDTDQSSRPGGIFSPLSGIDIGRDAFLSNDKLGSVNPPMAASPQAPISSAGIPGSIPAAQTSLDGTTQGQNLSQSSGSSSSAQLPTTQQRQMVMPDRMRWIYRDPQGNTQGPWSGLEMHDWFKAGFFTAELQVKKLEDAEYEPLAQLVRRIGNSREPFLVPQIGVPHGPAPSQSGSTWTGPGASGAASQSGVAQPPFPSSFPSFGTTLTADQQNALERRKQEEQYLMARQKEHLAQQQVLMKQMHIQNAPHAMHSHQLQHHSSAHSLHSQPSFGSITSPGGYQPSPIQGPIQPPQAVPGFFEPTMRQPNVPNMAPQMLPQDMIGGQDELPSLVDRLNINRSSQFPFNTGASFGARQQENAVHSQQVATMLQDRARLQQEQEQYDLKQQADSMFDQQARDERLRQFHSLRQQTNDDLPVRRSEGLPTHPPAMPTGDDFEHQDEMSKPSRQAKQEQSQDREAEPILSLSQQVQKAASAQRQQQQQSQSPAVQGESPWAKVDNGMPQPFPPPPSQSPLPAPAAQRNRQNVADALAAGSRSQSQTPIETPTTSIAPWAKEPSEAPKGPSLKEIQEAEARKAAKLEEAAAAARRALAEQERANPPPAPAPGLPSTANWASAGSPATPPSAGSVWTKPLGGKPAAPVATGPPKKTLAQIQKEEEARKQRLVAANNAQTAAANQPIASAGKRYADLASKVAPPTAPSGAWTTVGAGGKAKPPPAAPTGPRAIPVAPAAKPRPVVTSRPVALGTSQATNANKPTEELTKWAKSALGKGLNSSINVDDFVQQLLLLPPETEIISDSVYANSQTLDGRRFAEEFVRRRKLADKGIVDPASLNAGSNGFGPVSESATDGWNEVAKKGQSASANREDSTSNAAFKVVAAKKKGKR